MRTYLEAFAHVYKANSMRTCLLVVAIAYQSAYKPTSMRAFLLEYIYAHRATSMRTCIPACVHKQHAYMTTCMRTFQTACVHAYQHA